MDRRVYRWLCLPARHDLQQHRLPAWRSGDERVQQRLGAKRKERGMTIEYRPSSDFPFWVVREDGAIVCACPTEAAAEATVDAMKTHTACREIVGLTGFMVA
jgi:hypothetical protein